jgi:hypothetical protein
MAPTLTVKRHGERQVASIRCQFQCLLLGLVRVNLGKQLTNDFLRSQCRGSVEGGPFVVPACCGVAPFVEKRLDRWRMPLPRGPDQRGSPVIVARLSARR